MNHLLLGLLLPLAQAALPPKNFDSLSLKIEVQELLSMPAANRLQIAQTRRADLQERLEKYAFDEDVDFSGRWKALLLYAQLMGPAAKPILEKGLNSKDWFMRNAALVAVQEVLPRQAVMTAKRLLNDQALVVRSAAIEVLGANLDSEIREILWAEVDQPRNFRKKQGLWTRSQILEILSKEPIDRELPLFVGYLRAQDSTLHVSAMQGLEKLTHRQFGKPGLAFVEKRDLCLAWVQKNQNL